MIFVAAALALPFKWAIVPSVGFFVFLLFLVHNPVGRYLRLSVSVIGVWAAVIFHSAIDTGIINEIVGEAWIKIGHIPWYVHVLCAALSAYLLYLDFRSREGELNTATPQTRLTKNQLIKLKSILVFRAYIVSVLLLALIVTISLVDITSILNSWRIDDNEHEDLVDVLSICKGCHKANESSIEKLTPILSAQNVQYLIESLHKYKNKDRATDISEHIDIPSDSINSVAEYYANGPKVVLMQEYKVENIKEGKEIHDRYCAKCHEDESDNIEDLETGVLLAGQNVRYLRMRIDKFLSREEAVPKKMLKALRRLTQRKGSEGIDKLLDYYAAKAFGVRVEKTDRKSRNQENVDALIKYYGGSASSVSQ